MLTLLCLLYVVQVQDKRTYFETSDSEKFHLYNLLPVKINFISRVSLWQEESRIRIFICISAYVTYVYTKLSEHKKEWKDVHRIHTLPSRVFIFQSPYVTHLYIYSLLM